MPCADMNFESSEKRRHFFVGAAVLSRTERGADIKQALGSFR